MRTHAKMKVLLVTHEFPNWRIARQWSYAVQLGLEEGLRSHGIQVFSVTPPWFSCARNIYAGRKFDQVWVEAVHAPLDEGMLEWIAGLAPVRVAFLGESLEYTSEECKMASLLATRKQLVEQRMKYFTHAGAVDERDAENINAKRLASAMFWPVAVPARYVRGRIASPSRQAAVFSGTLYGNRAAWLDNPKLKSLLIKQPSSELGTPYPLLFNALQWVVPRYLRRVGTAETAALGAYLWALRRIRRQCFARWQRSMQEGVAVINLPSQVKGYASRVVEAMAVGCPVIAWEIPDRPGTKALFEDGKEILLYQEPDQLAEHVQHILTDPGFGQRMAANALCKVRQCHTMEKRVGQILRWIEKGEAPVYS